MTDQNGRFCFQLSPGKYILVPVIEPEEHQAGLILSPEKLPISISNAPVLDVTFSQVFTQLHHVINFSNLFRLEQVYQEK